MRIKEYLIQVKNGEIDLDEMDPVPEERTWTVGDTGSLILEKLKKSPFKFWKRE